jgi:acyl-coenzyme A synthetase/AMP-(fatty) acid ligase
MAIELLSSRVHERYDLSSLVLVGSTAAALPPAVAAGLAKALPGATIVNYYTSTEAAPAQTTMVVDPGRPGSVGRPIGNGLRVLGPDGEQVPVGETGEIWLRPPASPRTYLGEAGSPVFRDGWVRMGDLGRLDDAGYLYLVDRESDVVKSGAFKVSTLQVEAALHEHPDVAEAAVVGIPHPVLGSAVAAVVVAAAPLTLPAVRRFLADAVPAHALPTRLLLVEALPHNAAGKVVKARLREWLTAPDVPPATVPPQPR